ncbi:MAG: hypothetical protein IJS69_02920, partial [Selenomonadaceae bacterium]|nr:hypothetical protein [Selenomonadaceae bacterium]
LFRYVSNIRIVWMMLKIRLIQSFLSMTSPPLLSRGEPSYLCPAAQNIAHVQKVFKQIFI